MILFACNDAGPAKYISTLINHLHLPCYYWAGSNAMPLLSSTKAKKFNIKSDSHHIKLVVTGSSIVDGDKSVDKLALRFAKKFSLTSISIIEHWSWYLQRFLVNSALELPNYIILNDINAYREAVIDGLPADRLRILGNPYLETLPSSLSAQLNSGDVKQKLNIPESKRVITFISEELSSIPAFTGITIPFNEFDVLTTLLDCLSSNHFLLIKLHPEDTDEKYSAFVSSSCMIIRDLDYQQLSVVSDSIVGIASMLLIELSFIRSDIISFRPTLRTPLVGDKIGLVKSASTKEELLFLLNQPCPQTVQKANPFLGSTASIIEFICSFL